MFHHSHCSRREEADGRTIIYHGAAFLGDYVMMDCSDGQVARTATSKYVAMRGTRAIGAHVAAQGGWLGGEIAQCLELYAHLSPPHYPAAFFCT